MFLFLCGIRKHCDRMCAERSSKSSQFVSCQFWPKILLYYVHSNSALIQTFIGPSVVDFILKLRVWLFLNWYGILKNLTVCTMYCASSFQSSKEGSISWVSQLHTHSDSKSPISFTNSKMVMYKKYFFYALGSSLHYIF